MAKKTLTQCDKYGNWGVIDISMATGNVLIGNGNVAVAEILSGGKNAGQASKEEATRNARLIMKAPKLFALCKKFNDSKIDGKIVLYFAKELKKVMAEIEK